MMRHRGRSFRFFFRFVWSAFFSVNSTHPLRLSRRGRKRHVAPQFGRRDTSSVVFSVNKPLRLARFRFPTRYDCRGGGGSGTLRHQNAWCCTLAARLLSLVFARALATDFRRVPATGVGAPCQYANVPSVVCAFFGCGAAWACRSERRAWVAGVFLACLFETRGRHLTSMLM